MKYLKFSLLAVLCIFTLTSCSLGSKVKSSSKKGSHGVDDPGCCCFQSRLHPPSQEI